MAEFSLEDILANDPLGLLSEVRARNRVSTEDERLIASFNEINDFIDRHGKEPSKSTDMNERTLFSRLQGLREHPDKTKALKPYDRHNLLQEVEINSIDDILNDDSFGLLGDDTGSIFELKHVPKYKDIAQADFIASRKPCKEFHKYEALFKECQQDLRDGKRRLVKFNEKFMEEGSFFILKGVMVYLEKIVSISKDKHNKMDGRTYCVFENGTESNMLMRSLGKGLYEDGYFVSKHEDRLLDKFANITDEDKRSGFIYILKSKSTDEKIKSTLNLYKIGYSTTDVKERIKNAENEPTYLMAPVSVMGIYECYNMNTQKFEQLIHKFFGKACLNIDIFGSDRQRYSPREWFVAPLEIIEQAIELLVSGDIVSYRYDEVYEKIVLR